MAFEKGQTGNPGGRPKEKPWRDALNMALKDQDGLALRRIAEKTVAFAEAGEQWAVKEIADRMDGKAVQQQIVTGDEEGGPVRIERIETVIVDPANPNA